MSSKATAGVTTFRFDQMATLINDRVDNPAESGVERYVGLEHLDADSLRIRRWGEITDVESTKLRFQPGDIIFGKRRVYQRKLAVADFEGICSAHAMVLRAKANVVLPEFLPFFMQSDRFMERALAISVGSLSPTINWTTLAAEEFALPPIEEQQRIVALLVACEATRSSLLALRTTTQEAYLSLLVDLFGLARIAEPPHSVANDSHGNEWKWGAIEDHFDLQLGKMSSQKSRDGDEHARYIKNNNVLWDTFDLKDLPSMHFNAREREKFQLRPGDLLVCEGGEIGRAAVWSRDVEDVFYQKALHRLRPRNGQSSTRFMMHYLRASSIFGILEKTATGSTIMHLPQERLARLRLPFPSANCQREYAERLDRISRMGAAVNVRLQAFNGVKREALAGVVR